MANSEKSPVLTCLKILLSIFNFFFLISGIALLALGIWYVVDLHNYLELGGKDKQASSVVLISTGSLIMVVAVAACCCTLRAKYSFPLYLYCAFLCVVFLAELASGISLFVFKSKIEDDFSSSFNDTIHGRYSSKKKELDKLQKTFKCCGVFNYTDWFSVDLKLGNRSVPLSCCIVPGCNVTGLPPQPPPNATLPVYSQGCASKIIDFLNDNIAKIGGSAIAFAFLQLIGAMLSCCLGRAVSKTNTNYEHIN